jgi:hypothetical protein
MVSTTAWMLWHAAQANIDLAPAIHSLGWITHTESIGTSLTPL